jgi:hypothetical protein
MGKVNAESGNAESGNLACGSEVTWPGVFARMSTEMTPKLRKGFCIYIDTICQGAVPMVSDGEGKYVVFETELEAQREIVDHQITRLQEFLDGERNFEDAITVEEYVLAVEVLPDGTIVEASGK